MLGMPAAARGSWCWLATGRGAVAPFPLSSSPIPVPHLFSLCHPESHHGITALRLLGRRNQHSWPCAREWQEKAGRGSRRQENVSSLPLLQASRAQIFSPSAHLFTSTGRHDPGVAHCFGAEMLMEGRSTVPLSYTKNLCWDVREKGSLIKNLHIERSGSNK